MKYLKPFQRGDTVCMQLPGDQTWTMKVCEGAVAERSFSVKVGGTSCRHNRCHLRGTVKTQASDIGASDQCVMIKRNVL